LGGFGFDRKRTADDRSQQLLKGREGKGAKGSAKGSERRLKKVEEAIYGWERCQCFDDSKRSEGKGFSWIIYVALSQSF